MGSLANSGNQYYHTGGQRVLYLQEWRAQVAAIDGGWWQSWPDCWYPKSEWEPGFLIPLRGLYGEIWRNGNENGNNIL